MPEVQERERERESTGGGTHQMSNNFTVTLCVIIVFLHFSLEKLMVVYFSVHLNSKHIR
jgi:hypothetical protein